MKIIIPILVLVFVAGCDSCGNGVPKWGVKTVKDGDGNTYIIQRQGWCGFTVIEAKK